MQGVHRITPYLHVKNVQASVEFYQLLGLTISSAHRDHANHLLWAALDLHTDTGASSISLMLAQASGPIDPSQQAALLYMHARDLPSIRDRLIHAGIPHDRYQHGRPVVNHDDLHHGAVFDIQHPFYMPAGELRVHDLDGYVILIGQVD